MKGRTGLISPKLTDWLHENEIKYIEKFKNAIEISEGVVYEIIPEEDENTIDYDFNLNISAFDHEILDKSSEIKYITFEFGGRYYYQEKNETKIKFNPFKNIGESVNKSIEFPVLSVHGKYELMSGVSDYNDWIKRAKFLGINCLGITEKNTLAGSLPFQLECNKNNIKPIIGYETDIKYFKSSIRIKFYAKNKKGWRNILKIHKEANIINNGFIDFKFLKKDNLQGVVVVLFPNKNSDKNFYDHFIKESQYLFYQITTNVYDIEDIDKEILTEIKKYIDNKLYRQIKPVLLSDCYCPEKEQVHLRKILSIQDGKKLSYMSENHYLRHYSQEQADIVSLFEDSERGNKFFKMCFKNTFWIARNCVFKIDTDALYLPKYKMNEEESDKFENSRDLIKFLIKKGLKEKYKNSKYSKNKIIDRIKKESSVIFKNGFDDYFLIISDIINNFCQNEGITTGLGRGSSAGSMLSYLLGITKLDPLKYDLIFERFLNEGRLGKEIEENVIEIETQSGIVVYNEEEEVEVFRNGDISVVKARDILETDKLI